MAAKKKITRRLPTIPDDKLTPRQLEVMEAIKSGPRGKVSQNGPFGIYLYSPDTGDLVQALGGALPAQDVAGAAAIGICHSLHRTAVARPLRMARARPDRRTGRRHATDDP